MKPILLGEVLKEYGYITEEQLQQGLAEQKNDGKRRLGAILMDMGYVTEKQVLHALGDKLRYPLIQLDTYPVQNAAVGKIPKALALKYGLIGIRIEDGRLMVALNDPLNFYAVEDIRQLTNMPLEICLAAKADIADAIDYYYSEIEARKAANSANQAAAEPRAEGRFEIAESEADTENVPVVKLLNTLLVRGYSTGASDIHIEPFEKETLIRIRVDNMMIKYVSLASYLHQSMIARVKIMSNLDIAEKRMPQDGHFRTVIEGYEINVRVSVIPTVHGEKAVLRFLTTNVKIDHSGQLGMSASNYRKVLNMIRNPYGIIYLTGPTGSGKTTTLYMILEQMAQGQINISTIEDPVERNMMGINQMQVNHQSGLSFEVGLRALLRQDPDVIMVGETRDNETASISARAAITGHLVMSTLHTNNAVSTIVRLDDMGIPPYMIANSLVGVIAQRLVKKVCPHCGEEYELSEEDRLLLGEDTDIRTARRGKGCHLCSETGYKGRISVHEVLNIDGEIRKMISTKQAIAEIQRYAVEKQGMKTLKESMLELIREGVTSMDEWRRITYYED